MSAESEPTSVFVPVEKLQTAQSAVFKFGRQLLGAERATEVRIALGEAVFDLAPDEVTPITLGVDLAVDLRRCVEAYAEELVASPLPEVTHEQIEAMQTFANSLPTNDPAA